MIDWLAQSWVKRPLNLPLDGGSAPRRAGIRARRQYYFHALSSCEVISLVHRFAPQIYDLVAASVFTSVFPQINRVKLLSLLRLCAFAKCSSSVNNRSSPLTPTAHATSFHRLPALRLWH